MTYVFESGRYDRYMKKVFPNDIYEFMYDMDFYMELDQTLYDYNKISYLDNAELERLISTMEGLQGTKGIGRMTSFISFYPGVELSYGDLAGCAGESGVCSQCACSFEKRQLGAAGAI